MSLNKQHFCMNTKTRAMFVIGPVAKDQMDVKQHPYDSVTLVFNEDAISLAILNGMVVPRAIGHDDLVSNKPLSKEVKKAASQEIKARQEAIKVARAEAGINHAFASKLKSVANEIGAEAPYPELVGETGEETQARTRKTVQEAKAAAKGDKPKRKQRAKAKAEQKPAPEPRPEPVAEKVVSAEIIDDPVAPGKSDPLAGSGGIDLNMENMPG